MTGFIIAHLPILHFTSGLTSSLRMHPSTKSYLSILGKLGQHDDGSTLATVQHLPEVPTSVLHRILGNDEGFLLLVALHRHTDRQTDREREGRVNSNA